MELKRTHTRCSAALASVVLVATSICVTELTFASETVTTSFRMAGRDQPIVLVLSWSASSTKSERSQTEFSSEVSQTVSRAQQYVLANMGFRLIQRTLENAAATRSGIPVLFDANAAVGVLTSAFVYSTAHPIDQGIKDCLGAARMHEPAPDLGRDVWRGEAATPEAALEISNCLARLAAIDFAHPDFILPIEARSALPTHAPLFSEQWNLRNSGQSGGTAGADINVERAWERTLGSSATLVSVIDLGFEQTHPAFADAESPNGTAWFINAREVPDNRKDDDGNGLIDDVSGWNYAVNGTNLLYGAANKHGTASAGIIGARLSTQGTVGICPRCTLLPLVIDEVPSHAAAALIYARDAGAGVITNSWGYPINVPTTDVVTNAIAEVARTGRNGKGTVIVFAMSNVGRNDCRSYNPDISSHPDVIAVSTVEHNDRKVENAAHGPCLDIVAPSSGSTTNAIPTADRVGSNGYNDGTSSANFSDPNFTNTFWGTSAAAPQVAATLGLMLSVRPNATRTELTAALLGSAEKIRPDTAAYDSATGHSLMYGFGRLDAGRAVSDIVSTVADSSNPR